MTNIKHQTKEKGDTDVILYQERVTKLSWGDDKYVAWKGDTDVIQKYK